MTCGSMEFNSFDLSGELVHFFSKSTTSGGENIYVSNFKLHLLTTHTPDLTSSTHCSIHTVECKSPCQFRHDIIRLKWSYVLTCNPPLLYSDHTHCHYSDHTHLSEVSPVTVLHTDEGHVDHGLIVEPLRHIQSTHYVGMVESLDELQLSIPSLHKLLTQVQGLALFQHQLGPCGLCVLEQWL